MEWRLKTSSSNKNYKMTVEYLKQLKHSWTAEIVLKNNLQITIWWTCLPCCNDLKKIISVSSDYPKHLL